MNYQQILNNGLNQLRIKKLKSPKLDTELLLAKTLTATIAKPIAAIMTRTSSTSGYELGLLAAAGSLTILPGAVVIYFVRNYIAKGFAMGRV